MNHWRRGSIEEKNLLASARTTYKFADGSAMNRDLVYFKEI